MELILTGVGIIGGIIVSYYFYRKSKKESDNSLSETKNELILENKKIQESIDNALKHVNKVSPEEMKSIKNAKISSKSRSKVLGNGNKTVNGYGSEGNVKNGDLCPSCKNGTFLWEKWGPSPFGFFGAWYKCQECGYELPNAEVFGD